MSDRVLIVDDEESKAQDWADQLRPILGDRVVLCPLDDLKRDLVLLEERRSKARTDSTGRDAALEGTVFDDATVLIVDYDLFGLDPNQVLSGDRVAYLARCYSSCGLIVGVNQDLTERWFDLTMLDHPEAFTDLSIGAQHLGRPGLWEARADAFRPWHWPLVLAAAEQYERCVEAVTVAGAESDVLEILGIDAKRRSLLPRDVYSLVQGTGASPDDFKIATPSQLVQHTAMGLRLKDVLASQTSLPRVAAARLRKWLDTIVLQRQDLLVDAPHLVARLPGLLHDPEPMSSWGLTCGLHRAPAGLGIRHEQIEDSLFGWDPWLSRAAWWWPEIASLQALDVLRDQQNPHPELVFCEDASGFFERDECRRFTSRLGGAFAQRWVRMPTGEDGEPIADYEPAMRLTL